MLVGLHQRVRLRRQSDGEDIDIDACVGCQACVTACKGWNDQGYGAALSDQDPYGADPSGTFLNRVSAKPG